MLFKRLASAALATAVGLGAAGSALAEEVTVKSEDLSALIQRLEAAEKKIKELEQAPKAPAAPQEFDVPASVAAGSNGQPVFRRVSAPVDPEDPIFKRLEKLESNWVEMDAAQSDIAKQLKDGFIKDGSSNTTMKISGRIHADWCAFPDSDDAAGLEGTPGVSPQDRFEWRRVRFGVAGDIKDNMLYKIEMEFADPNDTQYRDVYIGFKDLPWLQTLLIGNQKRPFGLDHINSSRYNVFMERPMTVEAMNQDARRLCIASYGKSDDLAWNWRAGIYQMELTQDDQGTRGDNYQPQLAARLANTAWYDECTDGRSYIHWAVSGMLGFPDGDGSAAGGNQATFDTRPEARSTRDWIDTGRIAGADKIYQLGLEGVANFGPMQVVGELQQAWVQRTGANPDLYNWGAYGYVSYFLTGEHIPWDRETGQLGRVKPFQNFFLVNTCDGCTDGGWGALQLAARWSYADFSDENIQGGVGESFTLGVNWHWNPNARLQLNYINGNIVGNQVRPGNDADYNILGARFMVDF